MKKEIQLTNDVEFLPAQTINCGNIELLYEAGRTRYIRFNGEEVLRMIYPALRAGDWATIQGQIVNERISDADNSTRIVYDIVYDEKAIRYRASVEIVCTGNKLEFTMKGEALSDFDSKRVGLCVHHPIACCSGREVIIEHPDNKIQSYRFPELIAPVWPFTDIKEMRWKTGSASVLLTFEGDLFEMEDQRNWTDDSYKTYSGPQYKTPMLHIRKGDIMQHKVSLTVNSINAEPEQLPGATEIKNSFPRIGYSRAINQEILTNEETELLKEIPFDHYRVEINLDDASWKNLLHAVYQEAIKSGTLLELAVNFNSSEISEFIQELRKIQSGVECIYVFENNSTPADLFFSDVYAQLKKAFPEIKTGLGNNGWFADLNSCNIENINSDMFGFKVSPQVHQIDNRSILENLGSQSTTIETIRKRVGEKPVYVSPIVFSDGKDDARLHTSFGAWWTVNAICNFAAAGHITLYELKGRRGILSSPLFEVLRTIKAYKPVSIYKRNGEVVLENSAGDTLIFKNVSNA